MFGPQCISFIRLLKALFQGLGESWENRVRGRKLNGMPVNHCAPQIRNHTPRSSLAVQVHLPACFWEKTPYRRGEYVKLHTELLIESLDRPWSCEGQRCTTAPPKDKLKRGLVFHIVSHNPSYTHPLSLSVWAVASNGSRLREYKLPVTQPLSVEFISERKTKEG